MMDRYILFRKLMDLVSDDYDVVDADMRNYAGDIEIAGECCGKTIRIKVELDDAFEGVEQDA